MSRVIRMSYSRILDISILLLKNKLKCKKSGWNRNFQFILNFHKKATKSKYKIEKRHILGCVQI